MIWRPTLKCEDFRLTKSQTEHMKCKFTKWRILDYKIVTLEGLEIPMNNQFRYLSSIKKKGDR